MLADFKLTTPPPTGTPAFRTVHRIQVWVAVTVAYLTDRLTSRLATGRKPGSTGDNDRGDVPGWVMITVMTALVVLGLLTVFRDQVKAAVTQAFDSIRKAT